MLNCSKTQKIMCFFDSSCENKLTQTQMHILFQYFYLFAEGERIKTRFFKCVVWYLFIPKFLIKFKSYFSYASTL